ncbi:MAG: hypothetical protein GWN58_32720 [Anaerolineae bacterium]|nr:hypothetical protein [Thermoplasmata archaeon]NIV34039.1 hypothetical protein [Anaerolineae bacterium]NIY05890.1 hypothetical protein [Thermoplasmata archaeon]
MPERSKVTAFVETMDRIADVMNQDIIDDAEELLEELPELSDGWPEVRPMIQCHTADVVNQGLDALIEALQILRKYGNPIAPTHCEHDVMTICGIDPEQVSDEDKARLEKLHFRVANEWGELAFISTYFGSA